VYWVRKGSARGECMTTLPTGTVVFLFAEVVGSTRLGEEHPDARPVALARLVPEEGGDPWHS
jgi:class 3 adenylate cyclase